MKSKNEDSPISCFRAIHPEDVPDYNNEEREEKFMTNDEIKEELEKNKKMIIVSEIEYEEKNQLKENKTSKFKNQVRKYNI